MYLFRKEHRTVNTVFDSMTDTEKTHFTITFNNETLIESNIIISLLKQKYGTYEVIHSDDNRDVLHYWDTFKSVNQNAFKRIYDTLAKQYDTMENYDKYSEIINANKATMTSAGDVVQQATTEDSAIWNNTDKSISNANTTSNSNNTMTEHTHGNIGVTTNSQMGTQEILFRTSYNLAELVTDMYAERELI